jgi:hypothetical protein
LYIVATEVWWLSLKKEKPQITKDANGTALSVLHILVLSGALNNDTNIDLQKPNKIGQ